MSAFKSLEKNLSDIFVDKAPALPENGKKFIVEWLPWISLILGLLSLYTAYVLWNWAHVANNLAEYANNLNQLYGNPAVSVERMSAVLWLSLAVLVVTAVIYVLAFPALKARKKKGWDWLFYALLLNVVYGVVVLFSDYGGVSNLLGTLIGSAIGLYFLFQIRGHYTKARAAHKA